ATPDLGTPPRVVGHVDLPTPFAPNRQAFQRELARSLERARITPRHGAPEKRAAAEDARAAHPVAADPDLAERLRAAAQADRIGREGGDLRHQVNGRSD